MATRLVQGLLDGVAEQGIDVTSVMRRAGIAPTLVTSPRARLTAGQTAVLARALWGATRDELFGLSRAPVPLGTFRMATLGSIHVPDLHTALHRLSEFSRALPGVPAVTISTAGQQARIRVESAPQQPYDRLLFAVTLFLMHRYCGWLIGKRVPLHAAEFPYPPAGYSSDYHLVFGVPARFDAGRAALTFDSSVLRAPVVRDEADLTALIRRAPEDLLTGCDHGTSTSDRVRKILAHGLCGQWPTAEDVAARIALSPQHMRKLLRAESTSVSQIKGDILRDAAIASLTDGDESVWQLAERLGFSEPSAFRRAFRRWTGESPKSYRSASHAPSTG